MGSPRIWLACGFALLALLGAALWPWPTGEDRPRPNILVLCVDTLRADRLGYHGHARDTSPNIDALAARGARFRHAYSTYPATAPAVASLFTGLYPSAHRKDRELGVTLAPELEVLAESFRSLGYRTASVATNPNLSPGLGYEQGFEHLTYVVGQDSKSMHTQEQGDRGAAGASYPGTHTEIRHSLADYYGRGDAANQAALDWLDGLEHESRPFLLYLHYMDVHSPYVSPAPYQEMFVEERGYDQYCNGVPPQPVPPHNLAYMQATYEGGIRYLDALVAELLAALEQRGRLANTCVVFVADHGDEFLEHGGLGHGETLYRELLHVPLLIVGPGVPACDVAEPVSLVDLYPTLCELAGIPPPANVQGRSLVPLLTAEEGQERRAGPLLAECSTTDLRTPTRPDGDRRNRRGRSVLAEMNGLPRRPTVLEPGFSLVEGEWHLIHLATSGLTELYRYREDPAEGTDLAAQHPAEVERLLALGRALLERSEFLGRAVEPATIEVDDSTREQLEALGYAGEDG